MGQTQRCGIGPQALHSPGLCSETLQQRRLAGRSWMEKGKAKGIREMPQEATRPRGRHHHSAAQPAAVNMNEGPGGAVADGDGRPVALGGGRREEVEDINREMTTILIGRHQSPLAVRHLKARRSQRCRRNSITRSQGAGDGGLCKQRWPPTVTHSDAGGRRPGHYKQECTRGAVAVQCCELNVL
eukprot:GGOE01009003.1.p4 GENE.GGOE01009003.1~~GGOE01009003.1.p4  ORF type:complete len:185 (+),score=3.81 GGOE01009003.1:1245-1799(+)